MSHDLQTLADLADTIAERRGESPDQSYTAKLLSQGVEKCAKKFGEEAVELAIASVKQDKAHVTAEAADVLYHLLVLLAASDVPLGEVKIGVNTEAVRSNMIGQQMARAKGVATGPAPKFISLPSKYWDADTSGVTTTIKRGKNTFDIVLARGGK